VAREPGTSLITDRRPTIRLTFDRAMYRASVLTALTAVPAVPFTVDWESKEGADTAILTLQKPLTAGVRYAFTLARTAVDTEGVPLAEDYTWSGVVA
jgi:hypothetical protein